MKDIGKMIKDKEREHIITIMAINIKENGKMIQDMGKEFNIKMMVLSIKEIGSMDLYKTPNDFY